MVLLSLLLACTAPETMVHDGLERSWFVHVPRDLPDGAPLLLFLHGYGGDARSLVGTLEAEADDHGFVVAYPQGADDAAGDPFWDADLDLGDVDDVGFLSALAVRLQDEHGLDPARTWAGGISNGGFMSYALACHAPDVFRAAVSLVGTMSGGTWATCPFTPTSILQLSGTADDIVPMDGSMGVTGGWGGAAPVSEIVDRWAEADSCTGSAPLDVGDPATTAVRHSGCVEGTEVRSYVVDGMGHALPEWDWRAEVVGFLGGLGAE